MILSSTIQNISPTFPLVLQPQDMKLHSWCEDIGLPINPSVKVVTTDQSVAGRGVFAMDDLQPDERICFIPNALVFHPENCASCFPQLAKDISKSKQKYGFGMDEKKFAWIHKLWRKVSRKSRVHPEFYLLEEDDLWQPELTLYALEAIKQNHPWKEWIDQWNRDDPTYTLFKKNAKVQDENVIDLTAKELQKQANYLSDLHLKAALSIRLGRFEEQKQILPLKDDVETSSMYSLLGSRAGELGDNLTGVIPFHDMINHSLNPNLSISYGPDHIEIYANRPIEKGQELFLCYTEIGREMSDTNALWSLIQWGIPHRKEDIKIFDF